MTLEGKVALVLGGSRGIGAATARVLAEQGATVALSYLKNTTAAEAVAQSIRERGGKALLYQSDARDPEQVKRLVKNVYEQAGHLDILVHSVPAQGVMKPFLYMSWEEFIMAAQTELKSAYETMHAVLPLMREQHSGHIIFVTSDWAKHPTMPVLCGLVPAFGAIIALSKAMAKEFGPDGITVNTVSPGMVETELSAKLPPEVRQQVAAITPLGRIATPEDVAKVIAFLASDASGFITGSNISVNGGALMD